MFERQVAARAVPFYPQVMPLTGAHLQRKGAVPRIPVLSPRIQLQVPVDIQLVVIARVQRESMPAAGQRLDLTFPDNPLMRQFCEVCRIIVWRGGTVLIVELVIDDCRAELARGVVVARGESALLALDVVE